MAAKILKPRNIQSLINVVFSWSLADVLNGNLYNGQVKDIPMTFSSTHDYMNSFMPPLIEETHVDLRSNVMTVPRAPTREIRGIRKCKYILDLKMQSYSISFEERKNIANNENVYEPEEGDLFAVTDVRPRRIDDLNRPKTPYLIAFVVEHNGGFLILSSKSLPLLRSKNADEETGDEDEEEPLFAVYLTNLTTNMRIWEALNSKWEFNKIIKNILQSHSTVGLGCKLCSSEETYVVPMKKAREAIQDFKLDASQEAVVMSCVATSLCHHDNTVKLIWGPPGTGKTKTVGSLLSVLLKMKCRTLTCAPTNIAVVGVTKRLMSLVLHPTKYGSYGLGDIVLFGSKRRMKIDDHNEDLLDVFLDNREKQLVRCLNPEYGVKFSIDSMILLLEDPERMYRLRPQGHEDKEAVMKLEEFVEKRFNTLRDRLTDYLPILYTHLPTSFISLKVVKKIIKVLDLLNAKDTGNGTGYYRQLRDSTDFLRFLKSLFRNLSFLNRIPKLEMIRRFCLNNTCLVFCTVSSSVEMNMDGMKPMELLVVDEAAQLKECESAIPLQLEGLRHAILIGDERQLPAMVQSTKCEKAGFGRSLFERLVKLGHQKHLLNVQYRMHPSISLFPNKEFYDGQILDGPNVKERNYKGRFLNSGMFNGRYSFININHGKEEFDNRTSRRNMAEVAVVAKIVENLFKESVSKKQRVSVGCIAPYKAQVLAIQQKLGEAYNGKDNFSVNVRSVDGFQGGEEDVIIISTVRSNDNGSVGFLSNRQRTNVALTRARYRLWILGNGDTLINSGSVWKKLVLDAKARNCFHKANEDDSFAQAIADALVNLGQLDTLFNVDSPVFKDAKWKVCFSDEFRKTIGRYKNRGTCKKVISLLVKLATGWRQPKRDGFLGDMEIAGTASTLLELDSIGGSLFLVWTTDIVKENSQCIQIIKVWDIVPASKIQQLAKNLDTVYGKYSAEMLDLCKTKNLEGNLVLPMKWPMNSDAESGWRLASQLTELSPRNESGSSSSGFSQSKSKNEHRGLGSSSRKRGW